MAGVRADAGPVLGLRVLVAANQASPGGPGPMPRAPRRPLPSPSLRHEETPSNWHPSTQIGP